MAAIKPFQSIRPREDVVSRIAALPYDVYNREEALAEIQKEPLSFLRIDRPETQFDKSVDMYEACVYQKAKELLNAMLQDGTLQKEDKEVYYIYELIMDGRSQTGIVGCSSIDDYENNRIKKHENTRADKEIDRITHVDICNAQTGPIFLAYRSNLQINQVVDRVKLREPLYSFQAPDGVTHIIWIADQSEEISTIKEGFAQTDSIYIADGHHRAASAVKVGLKRRQEHKDYTGEEEYNYFLSVLFPHDQLMILSYNRVVKDLAGLSPLELVEKLKERFYIENKGDVPYQPEHKACFGMYVDHTWYALTAKQEILKEDPVEGLDVSILQDEILSPILNITDPRSDKRIDFVGGIRGLVELERRVEHDMEVAFSLYPTSILELFSVSDAGRLMPPKSTWFEPKLRSGIFIHELD